MCWTSWPCWTRPVTRPERIGWMLAVIICVVIPLALGYIGLGVVGGALLALAFWVLRRDGKL